MTGCAYVCASVAKARFCPLPTRVRVALIFQGTVEFPPPPWGFTIATDALAQIADFSAAVASGNGAVARGNDAEGPWQPAVQPT
jgi:hypothetical protein